MTSLDILGPGMSIASKPHYGVLVAYYTSCYQHIHVQDDLHEQPFTFDQQRLACSYINTIKVHTTLITKVFIIFTDRT